MGKIKIRIFHRFENSFFSMNKELSQSEEARDEEKNQTKNIL